MNAEIDRDRCRQLRDVSDHVPDLLVQSEKIEVQAMRGNNVSGYSALAKIEVTTVAKWVA